MSIFSCGERNRLYKCACNGWWSWRRWQFWRRNIRLPRYDCLSRHPRRDWEVGTDAYWCLNQYRIRMRWGTRVFPSTASLKDYVRLGPRIPASRSLTIGFQVILRSEVRLGPDNWRIVSSWTSSILLDLDFILPRDDDSGSVMRIYAAVNSKAAWSVIVVLFSSRDYRSGTVHSFNGQLREPLKGARRLLSTVKLWRSREALILDKGWDLKSFHRLLSKRKIPKKKKNRRNSLYSWSLSWWNP